MQVHYLYVTCFRYWAQLLHSFHITTYWEVTPICGPACSIARSLVHAISQLPGLTGPLPGHTLSIIGGSINITDIPSDIILSLSHTLHYILFILPWVEVNLHSTTLLY